MAFNKEKFADLLKQAKGDRSINQYALHSGVSAAHISRLMRCLLDTPPNPDTIKLLADKAYNEVTYDDLMIAAGHLEENPISKNNDKLGNRLKALRGERTQQQLADYLGITRPAYTAYERGTRQPDYETLQKLADFFDVSIDYLLGRTDKPANKSLPETTEKDIAKRLQNFKEEIEQSDGLAFSGDPLSDEAKETLIESMEYIFRQTAKINKKYTPKKYRNDE